MLDPWGRTNRSHGGENAWGWLGLLAIGIHLVLATPAAALDVVCLECFDNELLSNPFAPPVLLPGQAVMIGHLGVTPPLTNPHGLPSLQGTFGLRDGTELIGNLGYEPTIGLRHVLWQAGPHSLLMGMRLGYSYFRAEQLVQLSLPWFETLGDVAMQIEPQATMNRMTGNHLAMELALSKPLAGTTISLILQPDYGLSDQLWSGTVSVGASHALGAQWGVFGMGSLVMVDKASPMVSVGLIYLPVWRP